MCELHLTVGIMSRTAVFKTLCVKGGTHPELPIVMARGRKTALMIHLTPEDRATLAAWQRSTIIRAGLAKRGRLILGFQAFPPENFR